MMKRAEYTLFFTLFTLTLTLVIGWWLAGGVALIGLYLALLLLLPPLLWVAFYLMQKVPIRPFLRQFLAALGVQLTGLWLLYLVLSNTSSPVAFLGRLSDWRVNTLLFLPFWLAFLLTWLFFKKVPAVSQG